MVTIVDRAVKRPMSVHFSAGTYAVAFVMQAGWAYYDVPPGDTSAHRTERQDSLPHALPLSPYASGSTTKPEMSPGTNHPRTS